MFDDISSGLKKWPIWTSLAWGDITRRYRRNVLGPFWITLNTSFTIAVMAIIFSQVFHQDIQNFIPYLTAGMTVWTFIGSIINDSTHVFLTAKPIMFSIKLPISVHVFRMICKNVLIFAHVLIAFVCVFLYFSVSINAYTLLVIPAFLLVLMNTIWFSFLTGMMCSRYRDLSQILTTLFGISMYVTPIFWMPSALGEYQYLLLLNPLYCFLSIMRDSLLGQPPEVRAYLVCISFTLIGFPATWLYFTKNRNKLIFWI